MSYWYPRLNKHGQIASGNGEIWLDGAPLAIPTAGHSPQWYGTAEERFCIIGDAVRQVDMLTGHVHGDFGCTANPRAGNTSGVCAGAGHWCGWNPAQGLIYDGVLVDPGAAPGAVDQQTGALYYLTPYQATLRNVVLNGVIARAGVAATEIVGGDHCATWGEYEPTRTLYGWTAATGAIRLSPLASSELVFVGIPVTTPEGLWVVAQTHAGLIAFPWGGHDGYILEGVYSYHHALFLNGVIRIVATNEHGALREVAINLATPRTDLRTYRPTSGPTPNEPITPIRKPLWLGFFTGQPGAAGGWDTTDDPAGPAPPGNGRQDVLTAHFIAHDGRLIGAMVTGGTVEDIEQKAAAAPLTPICYWDARRWPRTPTLPAGAWLCVQGYCGVNETPAAFEADLRAILQQHIAERPQLKHAIVAQCYTSNAGNTTNLSALVPVFSRLAASLPLHALIPFSGNGRKTGLQDHPEVRPLWQELFTSITGTPDEGEAPPMGNGIDDNGVCVDPEAYFMSLVSGTNPADYIPVIKRISQDLYKYGMGSQNRSSCEPSSRLFMPHAGCPNVAPDMSIPKEVCLGVKQVEAAWQSTVDTVENHPGTTTPRAWVWHNAMGPAYQPIPAPGGPPDPPIDPPIGNVWVGITRYDASFQRGGPGSADGIEIVFDMDKARPIVEVQAFLNDGSPILSAHFPNPQPGKPDGRYYCGLRFKPVINGSWIPIVRVRNDRNEWGEARGATPVVVTSIV